MHFVISNHYLDSIADVCSAIQTGTKSRPLPCGACCLYYTIKIGRGTSIMVMVSSKHHSGREKRLQEKDKLPVRERYCIIPPLSF